MRLLSGLLAPFRILFRLLLRPLRLRAKKRALEEHGWVELHLEGHVHEFRPAPRLPPFVRRFLRREEQPRVVLSRLRKFIDELLVDPYAKGVLVRVGLLGGGWSSAAAIRAQLDRLRSAGKSLIVHVASHAGNREFLVATAGTKLWMTPSGALAAVGSSASTLFLRDALAKAGVKVEVASRGRYKSAPDQLTRIDRSDADLEQSKALVDELDRELIEAIMAGRSLSRGQAEELVDASPLIGADAEKRGYLDGLARDEDIPELVQAIVGLEKPPKLTGAGTYLELRDVGPIFERSKKHVGIVEVHGAIADRGSPYTPYFDRVAVQKTVINDLRAALDDPDIAAVVLHVDSRGGSVTASDAIFAAVRRLNREKPVIACFGDVSASGGYYVACGARAIVCSPLTITGSIGVFALFPIWPELGRWLGVNHDIIKNRRHAALYDPWREVSDEARAHADSEVSVMYETFLGIVAEARKKTRDEVHAVAEGRVWTGRAAQEVGLVDGLGGMEEAIARAKEAAGGRLADEPVLVRSRRAQPRPDPFEPKDEDDEGGPANARIAAVLGALPASPGVTLLRDLAILTSTSPRAIALCAYAAIEIS